MHTKLLLFKLNILTVVHHYQYAVCKLIYNSLHGTVPIFLCTMFEKNRNERNSQNIHSFYHKKKLSKQSVKYSGPHIWNKLPLSCKLFFLFFFFLLPPPSFRMITFDRQAGPLQNLNRSQVMVIGRSVSFSVL